HLDRSKRGTSSAPNPLECRRTKTGRTQSYGRSFICWKSWSVVDFTVAGKRELQRAYTRESQSCLGSRYQKRRRPRSPDITDSIATRDCTISIPCESEQRLSRISIRSTADPGTEAPSAVGWSSSFPGTRARRHVVRLAAGESDPTAVARTIRA